MNMWAAGHSSRSLTMLFDQVSEYLSIFSYLYFLFIEKGFVSSFHGNLLHGGDSIVSGTRYIIALFMIIIPVFREADKSSMLLSPDRNDVNDSHDSIESNQKEFSFRFF